MASLQELLQQRAELERQIEQLRQGEIQAVRAQVVELMKTYDLSIDEVMGGLKRQAPSSGGKGKTVAAKYRDSETGKSWSGRGLKPNWLKERLAQGKTLEDFAV